DAGREVGVVIEKERSNVIVIDDEKNVRLLLGEPLPDRLIRFEDRTPDRVIFVVPVVSEPDGRRMRTGDPTNYSRHRIAMTELFLAGKSTCGVPNSPVECLLFGWDAEQFIDEIFQRAQAKIFSLTDPRLRIDRRIGKRDYHLHV